MQTSIILVVDDEPEIRNLLTRFLVRKGFEVYCAGTIKEGRRLITTKHPNLIFLDVNLPDGNGLDELQKFSEHQVGSKIIMMSAFDHEEARKKALGFGAIEFLSKPFNIQQLNKIVHNQL